MREKKHNILMIDDEDAILFAFQDEFLGEGICFDTAQSLEEAKSCLENNIYHGAVIDLRLSGTKDYEGLEAIKMVKDKNPQCKVISITAYAEPGFKESVFKTGADYFVEKPVSPQEIKNIFRSMGVL